MAVSVLTNWTVFTQASANLGSISMPAGSNRLMLVEFQMHGNLIGTITAASYGGQPMTQVEVIDTTALRDMHSSLWSLDEAGIAAAVSAGNDDFAITRDSAANVGFVGAAIIFSGVDQSSPIQASDTATANEDDPRGANVAPVPSSLATSDGGHVIVHVAHNEGTSIDPDPDVTPSNWTERDERGNAAFYWVIGDTAVSASSFTPAFTTTGFAEVSHYIAASIAPAEEIREITGALLAPTPTVDGALAVSNDIQASLLGQVPTVAATLEVSIDIQASLLGLTPDVSASLTSGSDVVEIDFIDTSGSGLFMGFDELSIMARASAEDDMDMEDLLLVISQEVMARFK